MVICSLVFNESLDQPLRVSVLGAPPSHCHGCSGAVVVLHVEVDPDVRVAPFDLGDRAGQRHRLVGVELGREGMVCGQRGAAVITRKAPRQTCVVFMRTLLHPRSRARKKIPDQILRFSNPQILISSNSHVSLHYLARPRDVSPAVAGRQAHPVRPVGDRQPEIAGVGEEARRARSDPHHARARRSHRRRGGDRPLERRADDRAVRSVGVARPRRGCRTSPA